MIYLPNIIFFLLSAFPSAVGAKLCPGASLLHPLICPFKFSVKREEGIGQKGQDSPSPLLFFLLLFLYYAFVFASWPNFPPPPLLDFSSSFLSTLVSIISSGIISCKIVPSPLVWSKWFAAILLFLFCLFPCFCLMPFSPFCSVSALMCFCFHKSVGFVDKNCLWIVELLLDYGVQVWESCDASFPCFISPICEFWRLGIRFHLPNSLYASSIGRFLIISILVVPFPGSLAIKIASFGLEISAEWFFLVEASVPGEFRFTDCLKQAYLGWIGDWVPVFHLLPLAKF